MDFPPRAKRSNVFMDADLNLGEPLSATQRVRIRDLSEGGARIHGRSPGVGAAVVVTRGETAMPGQVVWTADRHFGVAFDEPIDVEAVLKAAGSKAPTRPVYAAALTSGLSQVPRSGPRGLRSIDRTPFGLRLAPPG